MRTHLLVDESVQFSAQRRVEIVGVTPHEPGQDLRVGVDESAVDAATCCRRFGERREPYRVEVVAGLGRGVCDGSC